jgi:hypothetical protein
LEVLCRRRAEIESTVTQIVTAARTVGVSWSAIGAALGVSAQAAQQRYGSNLNGKPTRQVKAERSNAGIKHQPLKPQGALKQTPVRPRAVTPPRQSSTGRPDSKRGNSS